LDFFSPPAALETQRSLRLSFFSFAAERPANENHHPLRGNYFLAFITASMQKKLGFASFEEMVFFSFLPLFTSRFFSGAQQKRKRDKITLRSLRLCGEKS
jgi:hypothetical protein